MKTEKSITDRVKSLMHEKKISNTQIAAAIGVSRQAMTKMLERPYLSTDHLDKICDYLGYDFYQHLGGSRRIPPTASITIPITKDNMEALLKLAGIKE